MIVNTYTCSDLTNVVVKNLTNENTLDDVKLKDATEIINPELVLKSQDYPTFNYCYLPKFNRYYFVTNITVTPNNIYRISLDVDVLMSFKDDILNGSGYITKSKDSNPMYQGDQYGSLVTKQVNVYNSDVILPEATTEILVTVGGV